jgi:hypothetical protein
MAEVSADNLFIQYDIYHMQRMEGELADHREYLRRIAHLQLADNPGRNEPGTGEINYGFLLRHLDKIGYMNIGFIGLGIMGAPMAGHLIAAGHSAFVYTRSGVAQELLDAGGKACACKTGAEVAEPGRHHLHDGAGHAGRREGAVRQENVAAGLSPARRWST